MIDADTVDRRPRSIAWTEDLVCRELVEAFRRAPGTAIFSPRASVFRPAGLTGALPAPFNLIAETARILGRDSEVRKHLLAWARCQATRHPSLAQVCKDLGWRPATVYENRARGCSIVARALNLAAVPVPKELLTV